MKSSIIKEVMSGQKKRRRRKGRKSSEERKVGRKRGKQCVK